MISLTAPKITATQRKDLERHKVSLEEAISAVAQHSRKVSELSKLEVSLERKAASLQRKAAKFDVTAESELSAVLRQRERAHDAIREAESAAVAIKPALFQVINQSQELISKICQHSYHELLGLVATAMCPFYLDYPRALQSARDVPAVNDLGRTLLARPLIGDESMERVDHVAREMLSKVNSILNGDVIWTFPGCSPPAAKNEKMAA